MPILKPGDIVVMDNLSSYKGVAVSLAIEALWSARGRLIDLITPTKYLNMFAAAGYDPN